ALALQAQDAVPAVVGQVRYVPAQRLADPQACVRQQGQEGDRASAAVAVGGRQQPTQLVPGESWCLAPVGDLRAAHVLGGGVGPQALGDEIAVPAGDGRQPPGQGAWGGTACLQGPGPCIGVSPPGPEWTDAVRVAEAEPR